MGARHKTDEVIHLVKSPKTERPVRFAVGSRIPASGIYRAVHGDHRTAHELTLLVGRTFPRCKKCGNQVMFELIREAPDNISDRDFRVELYEIPHPESDAARPAPGQVA